MYQVRVHLFLISLELHQLRRTWLYYIIIHVLVHHISPL
jgi:hypothetical protein